MNEEFNFGSSVNITALLAWVQIFKIESPHKNASDFTDGIAFAEILHEIDPVYFGPTFLDGFVQDCGHGWRLKLANLQRVLSRIQDFFLEVTGNTVSSEELLPDLKILAEFTPSRCAVQSSRRQHFIEAILNLETEVQAGVMEAVKMVLERNEEHFLPTAELSTNNTFQENTDDIITLRSQLQAALQSKAELNDKVKQLEEELNSLKLNLEAVKPEKSELESENSRTDNSTHELIAQRSTFHEEKERLRDEIEKIDASREEWRQKAESAEHDAASLRTRVAELVALNRETKRLKDELDVARHAMERLPIAESQIEQLQRKVEQSGSAQRKLKSVEERLQIVLSENTSLQEQLNRLRTVTKRRSNANDSPTTETPSSEKQLVEDDAVNNMLKLELLQRQFEEATSKLVDTREQLVHALAQNRALVDENARLREAATESTCASFETLPTISREENEMLNLEGTSFENSDTLVSSLKAEVARLKNESLIMEQRYKKYLERARAIVKLVSVTASANSCSSRSPSGTAYDLNLGANFVTSGSALSQMRTQLRLLAENSNRCLGNPINTLSLNGQANQSDGATLRT